MSGDKMEGNLGVKLWRVFLCPRIMVIKHRENNVENKLFIYVCIYLTWICWAIAKVILIYYTQKFKIVWTKK